jgi:zinc transporter
MLESHSKNPSDKTSPAAALLPRVTRGDAGLICGFVLSPSAGVAEVELEDIADIPLTADSVLWLHFNLTNTRARQAISRLEIIPAEVREVLTERDDRRRVEALDEGLLTILSDLTFEPDSDPEEVSPLWCFIGDKLFVTGRVHPLKTVDELRSTVRGGLKVGKAIELLIWFLARRTASLRDLTEDMAEQVSEIEDEILGGAIRQQREQLGRIRRFCAQIRRHFGPDRVAFRRWLQLRPALLDEELAESMRSEIEELSFLIDEVNELYERAKLLQEELASRVAENTGRSLYVLAILSAVFLPMTLITGIFGMNVAGLPGLHHYGAFWWVMFLIVIAGGVTLGAIFWRRP